MKRRSKENAEELRARILGFGEHSVHKSYYPQLQDNLADLRLLFDSVHDALFVHDAATFAIIDVNNRMCEMYGWSREEALALSVAELSAGRPPYAMYDAFEWLTRARNGENPTFEWLARHRTGRLFWVEANMRFVPSPRRPRILVAVRDVSDRKRSEEMLRQSEKLSAIGQLAGGLAHDFNNQLSAILGFSELIASRLRDLSPEGVEPALWNELEDAAAVITAAARRSADLTHNLLTFARKGKHDPSEVDLRRVLEQTVAMLARSIDRRIRLETSLGDTSAPVLGDAAQLQNAILNLGINARDAMPDGGTLTLTLAPAKVEPGSHSPELPPGDYFLAVVKDSGGGMTDDVLAHLFEPFFTTKPAGKGTGLGLAAVYGTVRQHGGAIAVSSRPGAGAEFRLWLPALATSTRAPAIVARGPRGGAARRTVLVADDDLPFLEFAGSVLRGAGHEVLTASDGTGAATLYRREWQRIDVVLLDLVMPGMNGHEVLRVVREVNPAAVVVVTSGLGLDETVQVLVREGARGFLPKPYGPAELLEQIEVALGSTHGGT